MGRAEEARTGAGPERAGLVLAMIVVLALALGWQFMADASRAVPALDTAWYQWRAELLQVREPAALIAVRGAEGSLAGGYRVAEPVLAALMRTVGGVGAATPTVLLSVLLRVLAAAGVAAFAWRHRRDTVLLLLTLAVVPALFLLQRFFGFLDNYLTVTLLAGVLLLLDDVRVDWSARAMVLALLVLGGLSHPTTVVLFLASYGAVVVYRLARDRSIAATARGHGPFVLTAAAAVALVGAVWLGGLWGRIAGFGEAAVPPPQPVAYFVDRSLNVLGNMTPWVLVPVIAVGGASLIAALRRSRSDPFAEVTLAWTLPLAGMLGFLVGAAYPYFRFFNATLAPPVLAALGIAVVVRAARRIPAERVRAALAPMAVAGAVLLVGAWWARGLTDWTSARTWLTPEVREPLAAADAYLAEAPDRRAVFVIDAEPGGVPYGEYKEHANAIRAGLAGRRIDRAVVFFGRLEDLVAGRPTLRGDPQYDALSRDSAREALPWFERDGEGIVLMVPAALYGSGDQVSADGCVEGRCGVVVGESELAILPVSGTALGSPGAVEAARRAAAEARAFAADPPGPLRDLGRTLVVTLRLALLILLPGWLLVGGLPRRSRVEGVALVPILGAALVTAVGVAVLAILRAPLSPGVGWSAWGIAVALGLGVRARRRRRDRAATG